MTLTYGSGRAEIAPAKLPIGALTAIGRLIRAFAEIEDAINLRIGGLAQTTEGVTAIFLGRMAISAKLKMAFTFAQVHGRSAEDLHKKIFDASFYEALAVRNVVAHGVFLGRQKKSKYYSFLTSNQLAPVSGKLRREVVSFTTEDLRRYAKAADEAVTYVANALGVTTSREKRFQQFLLPHRKSQSELQREKGRQSQPPSPKVSRKEPKISAAQRRKVGLYKRSR